MCSRQRINRYCTRDDSSSDWVWKMAIIFFLALIWTGFVNHNGRDTMNENIGAYRPFLSESVPLSFSESSPTTLAVFRIDFRDDLNQNGFSNCCMPSEKCRTSRHQHTQPTLLLILSFVWSFLTWPMLIPQVILIRSARIYFIFLILLIGRIKLLKYFYETLLTSTSEDKGLIEYKEAFSSSSGRQDI